MNGNRTKMEKIKITRWPLKDRISWIPNEQSGIYEEELNQPNSIRVWTYSWNAERILYNFFLLLRRWTKKYERYFKQIAINLRCVCVSVFRSTIFLKFITRAEQIFNIFRMEKIKLKILDWERWQVKRIKAIVIHFTIHHR